jgi:hypothetical protein
MSLLKCLGRLLLISFHVQSASVSSSAGRMVVKHSGTLGLASGHVAICTSSELAEYALKLAVGPEPEPKCRPEPGQGLWPSMRPQFLSIPVATATVDLPLLRTDARQHNPKPSNIYFAHLYVVQSTEEWCPHPCMSPSWELAAPKPEEGSPYLLLEASIWRQSRTVTLYHFDAAWEKTARAASIKFCEGKSWGCTAYQRFREGRALFSAGPWPAEADTDPKMLSSFLRSAFIQIFDEVHRRAGLDAHIGLTYSGHGGLADGSLFAGALQPQDSTAVLQHATSGGRRLSMLNWARNCEEGRWNMLQALHPFADWILASDLKVGGIDRPADPVNETRVIAAMEHLQDVAVLKRAIEDRTSPEAMVKQIVDARQQLWESQENAGVGIIRQHLRQSLSGFRAANFPTFRKALSDAFWSVPAEMRLIFTNYVESSSCDVLIAARLLGDSVSGGSTGSNVTFALAMQRSRNKQHKSSSIELQFQALRPFYTSTKSLFTWDTESNGLAFNRIEMDGKCDFITAFGESASASSPGVLSP